jgi:amidase
MRIRAGWSGVLAPGAGSPLQDLSGTTNDAWATRRTPGGSSGGSAAAVAAGMTGLGLGGDLAGSTGVTRA